MRWAVSAIAILVTLFLMASLAKFGAVEANPRPFECPDIQIDYPLNYPSDIYQETSIPIEVRVSPYNTGRKFVDIYYSLDDGPNIPLSIFTLEGATCIFGKGTLDNLTDGYHTVEVFSTDTQGNTISDSTTILVNTTIRFSPFLLSPTNTTYYSKEIPFTYTIDDSKYIIYISIDNYSDYRVDGNTTLPELSEGQHTITARAYDLNGVIYSKQTAKFTIDTTSPAPTSSPEPTSTPSNEPRSADQQVIVVVAITAVVTGVSLGLLLYLIKRK
jgi:hypothetical protein